MQSFKQIASFAIVLLHRGPQLRLLMAEFARARVTWGGELEEGKSGFISSSGNPSIQFTLFILSLSIFQGLEILSLTWVY